MRGHLGSSSAGFGARRQGLLRACCRLVLIALVLQIAGVDHWRTDVAAVAGVAQSQRHVLHCHGDRSGCADSAGAGVALPAAVAWLPTPALPRLTSAPPAELTAGSPVASKVFQPPRAVA